MKVKTDHYIFWILLILFTLLAGCQRNEHPQSSIGENNKNSKFFYTVQRQNTGDSYSPTRKSFLDTGDDEAAFNLRVITLNKGKVIDDRLIYEFVKSNYIPDFKVSKDNSQILMAVNSGFISSLNLKNKELKYLSTSNSIGVEILDWPTKKAAYLYSIYYSEKNLGFFNTNDIDVFRLLNNEIKKSMKLNEKILLHIWDAKFIPNTGDELIGFHGMLYNYDNDSYSGVFCIYDVENRKLKYRKNDYGVLNSDMFISMDILRKSPAFSLSPDGKKSAYIADYKTNAEQKKSIPFEEWGKSDTGWETTGLYVIDLEDETKEPELVEMRRPFDDKIVWSPDGKYILAREKLFMVKDKGYEPVKIDPDFNPKYYDDTAFSPDGNYLVYGQDGEKKDEKVWYVLYLPEKKIIPIEEDVLEMDWER